MRHLVTGGAGFVGSHLIDALVARGDSVVALDDLSTGRRDSVPAGAELVEGSVLDEKLVDDCMREVDACHHLAAVVGVKLVVQNPSDALRRNVLGTDVVMSVAARRRRRLLFTSSSEVYGKDREGTLAEDSDRTFGTPFQARWAYGTSKTYGEVLAHSYARDRGIQMVVARLFNAIGPRQTGAYGMVLPRFVRQALGGEPLTVYGDGTQSRCFLHVRDAVSALVHLIDNEEATGGVFNVGSSENVSILELARRVIERSGSDSEICFVQYADAYGGDFEDLARRVPDTGLISRTTGWAPAHTIAEAIDDVIAFERVRSEATRSAELAG